MRASCRHSQVQDASPLSPLHHTSHWQPISLLDSEFQLRDHLKHFNLSPFGANVTPGRLSTTFELLPIWLQSQICPTGEIMTNDFFIFSLLFFFFSLHKLKCFQQRVIQHGSFSSVTFTNWQRGRSRFKWKTLKFLEVRFHQMCPFLVCERKVKWKVGSVLVHFFRMHGDSLEFTLGNTDW